MAIVRWDPFRDLNSLQSSINRLFDDNVRFLREPESSLNQTGAFPVDIQDTNEAILFKAELPGFDKKEIKISLKDSILNIRAERQEERKDENSNYIRMERSYGLFSRSFTLNDLIDQEKMKAQYQDGVLEITLPKKADTDKKETYIDITE